MKKILYSIPDVRAVRFKDLNFLENNSTIGVADFGVQYDILEYIRNISRIRQLYISIAWFLKNNADVASRKEKGEGFVHSIDSNARKILSGLFKPLYKSKLLDYILVSAFKSKKLDELVKKFSEINIYTFQYFSEAFLYSSAIRNKISITFSPDSLDSYYAFWIPRICDKYESWGGGHTHLLNSSGMYDNIVNTGFPITYHFNSRKSNNIVIYGGSYKKVSRKFQMEVILKTCKYANSRNLRVILKLPQKTEIDIKEVEALDVIIIHNSYIKSFDDYHKNLSLLIKDARLFVCFGPSHGIIEFGLNNVPSVIFNPYLYASLNNNNWYLMLLKKYNVPILNEPIPESFEDDYLNAINLSNQIFAICKKIVNPMPSNYFN